jgi:hypothetical protein
MRRIDDIEKELNAVKYWLRLLFVMQGITSEQVSRHIAELKNQVPQQLPELPQGEFESRQAERLTAIQTVGRDIAEYLERFERATARRRSQKPGHQQKK